MVGSLLAIAALSWMGLSVSEVILWSVVPGVLVLLLLVWGVREPLRLEIEEERLRSPLLWSVLSHSTRRYLLVLVLFTFARASESFILLRGNEIGLSEGSERALISVYAQEHERGTAFGWYHLAVGLSAIPAGVLFGTLWHYWGRGRSLLLCRQHGAGLCVVAAIVGISKGLR